MKTDRIQFRELSGIYSEAKLIPQCSTLQNRKYSRLSESSRISTYIRNFRRILITGFRWKDGSYRIQLRNPLGSIQFREISCQTMVHHNLPVTVDHEIRDVLCKKLWREPNLNDRKKINITFIPLKL